MASESKWSRDPLVRQHRAPEHQRSQRNQNHAKHRPSPTPLCSKNVAEDRRCQNRVNPWRQNHATNPEESKLTARSLGDQQGAEPQERHQRRGDRERQHANLDSRELGHRTEPIAGRSHYFFPHKSHGFFASVLNGRPTFLPVRADSYAAKMTSSTTRASSPVTSGFRSNRTQSTKWAISAWKP